LINGVLALLERHQRPVDHGVQPTAPTRRWSWALPARQRAQKQSRSLHHDGAYLVLGVVPPRGNDV